jgi:hypothetical protein
MLGPSCVCEVVSGIYLYIVISFSQVLKFALNINREGKSLTPQDGLPFGELGVLINHLDKAINPKDGLKCTLSSVQNHGYTPHFHTESKILYNNFLEIHRNIQEKEVSELKRDEATYANTLRRILSTDLYVEPLDNDDKPLLRLTGKEIEQGVETYGVITTQSGVISEIGSPKLDDTRHIYLHNSDYKIFINPQQEEILKQHYRNGVVELKLKQRRSVKTGRITGAQLVSIKIKSELTLSESVSMLSPEELASLGNFESAEDILTLLRS